MLRANWKVRVPATDDLALRLTDSDIVANNHKLDAVRFVRVLSSILLLCESKVQDVSRVVSDVWFRSCMTSRRAGLT